MMREMMIMEKVERQGIIDQRYPVQVTIGTNNTKNNMDNTFNKNCYQEKGGEIVDDEVDDYQ